MKRVFFLIPFLMGMVAFSGFVYAQDTTPPQIEFVNPTDTNGTTINRNYSYVNVTITDDSNTSSFIDWNRSLIGYWAMDWYNSSGIYDNSSYNNFGNFNGGLETGNITTGKYGKSLNFDGVNDYVDARNISSLSPSFTVAAWIKPTQYSSYHNDIVSKRDSEGWTLAIGGPSTDPMYHNKLLLLKDGNPAVYSLDNITLNAWSFVTVTYNNATNSVALYINGSDRSNSTFTNVSFVQSVGNLTIGRAALNVGGYYFKGSIDEVRIWNRVLTPVEINASYDSGLYRLYRNFTGLPDGNYQYYVHSIDADGNANRTETRTLTVDTKLPKYSNNSTNSSIAGSPVKFGLKWDDNALNNSGGYIFSLDNGNGDFVNDSFIYWGELDQNSLEFTNGLIGYWKLNSVNSTNYTFDSSGWGNDGHLFSNPLLTTGKFDDSLSLNYTDGIQISSSQSINSTLYDDVFTYDAWIFLNGSTNGDIMGFYGYNIGWGYSLIVNGNKLALRFQNDTQWIYHNSNELLKNNTWYHVAVTYDRVNVKFYVNGTLTDTQPETQTTNNTGIEFRLGYNGWAGRERLMDEARVWNRSLSANEISALYNLSKDFPTKAWSNITKIVNSTKGSNIRWKVYANDTNGNWNTSETYSFTTTLDISIALDSNKTSSNGKIISRPDSEIQLYGRAFYTNGTIYANRQLNFTYDTRVLGSNSTDSNGNYSFIFSILYEGKYNLEVSAIDGDIVGENSSAMLISTHPLDVKYNLNFNFGNNRWDDLYKSGAKYVCGYDDIEYADGLALGLVHSYQTSDLEDVGYEGASSQGLVGYWKFDDNSGLVAVDSSDNGNSGNLMNGTVTCGNGDCPNWIDGKYDKSLLLDGINDYVNVSASPSLNITGSQITLEAWIKIAGPVEEYQTVVGSDTYTYRLLVAPTAILLQIKNSTGNILQQFQSYWFSYDTWYHVAGTYDGNELRVYVNGNQIGSPSSGAGNIIHIGASDEIRIGKTFGDNYHLNGTIDEVKLYNRSLTGNEIKDEYNSKLRLKQDVDNSQLILAFTKGTCDTIDNKMYLIDNNQIPSRAFSSFAYTIPSGVPVLIQFKNDKLQINGSDRFSAGDYKICVENLGKTLGNRPMMGVGKC